MSWSQTLCVCFLLLLSCTVGHVTGSPQWRPMGRFGKRVDHASLDFFSRLHPIHDSNTFIGDVRENIGDNDVPKQQIVDIDGRPCVQYPGTGKIQCFGASDERSHGIIKK